MKGNTWARMLRRLVLLLLVEQLVLLLVLEGALRQYQLLVRPLVFLDQALFLA
jgi:hypothetical protein